MVRASRAGALVAALLGAVALYWVSDEARDSGDEREPGPSWKSCDLPTEERRGEEFEQKTDRSPEDGSPGPLAKLAIEGTEDTPLEILFVDSEAAALSYLSVTDYTYDGVGRTCSDSRGRVRLAHSRPYRVVVDLTLHTSPWEPTPWLEFDIPKSVPELTIEVPVGWIRGRVLDQYGTPVPGAQVLTLRVGETYSTKTTGADGQFSVCFLQGADYSLELTGRFDAPDMQISGRINGGSKTAPLTTTSCPLAHAGDRDVILTFSDLDARGLVHAKVVADDGSPIPGATVMASPGSNSPPRKVMSDADGVAVVDRLPIGPLTIHSGLWHGTRQDPRFYFPEPMPAAGDGSLVTIVARRCRTIRGRVCDAGGNPAGSALIHVVAPGYSVHEKANEDGSFEVSVPPADVGETYLQFEEDDRDSTNAPPTDDPVLVYPVTECDDWTEIRLPARRIPHGSDR